MKKNLMAKAIAAISAVAMSVTMLAGCGNSSSSSSQSGLGTKDNPVTLTFWTWQPTEGQWKDIYSKFEKKYPNIKIKWWRTAQQDDYQKKLQTSMAGGEGPDVFGLQTGSMVTQYGRFAADMTPLANKYMSGWKNVVNAGAVRQMTNSDGKLTAMPTITSGSEYLLYNKTFLKEQGIDTAPTTYQQLKEDCDKLRAKGIIPMALGAKDSWHNDDIFVWLCDQYNSKAIYSAQDGKAKFTDPTFVKAMTMWKKMKDDNIFQSGAVGTTTYPDARDNYFYSRKSPFFPTGSWHVSVTIPNDETRGTSIEKDEIGMIPFPRVGSKDTPTTGVDFGLAINKDSKKQAAAMKFVEFMTTGAGQQTWINTLQGAPVDKNIKVQLPSNASETAKESVNTITEGQSTSRLDRKLKYQDLNDEISVQMQNVYTGTTTVKAALEAIQKVNEGIDRSGD